MKPIIRLAAVLLQPLMNWKNGTKTQTVEVPFPFKNTDEMLQQADNSGMSLGGMILKNEAEFEGSDIISEKADQIWRVMSRCMERGFETEGILDGGLNVTRRAPNLLKNSKRTRRLKMTQWKSWIGLTCLRLAKKMPQVAKW